MRRPVRSIRPDPPTERREPRDPAPAPEKKEPSAANKYGRAGRPDPDRSGVRFPGGHKRWPENF